LIFDYATQFAQSRPQIDSVEIFEFNDWEGFQQFARSKNFDYQTISEKKMTELREIATREGFPLGNEIQALEEKVKVEKKNEMLRNKERILHEIEQEIVGRYYFQRGKVRKNLVNDPEIKAAINLLNDPTRYQSILEGK
jgi:carboxyl-terminal processing protease